MRGIALSFLALVPLVLLVSCGSKTSHAGRDGFDPTTLSVGQGAAAPGGGSYLNAPIPAEVLQAELFDSAGKKFTLASLHGKTIVIADFLTSCQEICPMTSVNMRNIGDAIAVSPLKSKVSVIELSVDSERDTPSRLRAYSAIFHDNNWLMASGSEKSLSTIWKFFGNNYSKNPYTAKEMQSLPPDWQTGKKNTFDITHTDEVLIVNAAGSWSWLDLGNPNPGKSVVPDRLKKFLSEDGLNNLAKPQEPSWTPDAVLSALSAITKTTISSK